MKTIVLDDDPTGTQSATGVRVLLEPTRAGIEEALRTADAVYVQTNSRALPEAEAVALVQRIRRDGLVAAEALAVDVRFVLRGDSTLRGHVFAETDVFAAPTDAVLFVPAFPAGGRTTVDGEHYLVVNGTRLRADETEFADDPVFGFASSTLVPYVAAAASAGRPRTGVSVPLDVVRRGGLPAVVLAAGPDVVVLPDVETDDDIRLVASAVRAVEDAGRSVVVRSAAPLAAELAGVASTGLLPVPVVDRPVPTLLAVGSHTAATSAQLAAVTDAAGIVTLSTELALSDPAAAGNAAASSARASIADRRFAVVATARERLASHGTLDHGERVMAALTTAVRGLLPDVGLVVAKGGITSAEVARTGIGATSADVLGQILPGISLWRMTAVDGRSMLYVVVPGNVGDDDTLVRVLAAVGVSVVTVHV